MPYSEPALPIQFQLKQNTRGLFGRPLFYFWIHLKYFIQTPELGMKTFLGQGRELKIH